MVAQQSRKGIKKPHLVFQPMPSTKTVVIATVTGDNPVELSFFVNKQFATTRIPDCPQFNKMNLQVGEKLKFTATVQLQRMVPSKRAGKERFKKAFRIFGVDKKVTS
jgi:hypothetical protein